MKQIIASAPMRVDFAGGTIDLPPLFLFHFPAVTINAAVTIKATITIAHADRLTISSRDQNITASWESWEEIDWQDCPSLELVCRITKSFKPAPVLIEIASEAPAGSGLGGSSVIAIALTTALATFTEKSLKKPQLIEYAKSIETQAIKVPTGYQDYWGAVYGGLRAYQINLDGSLLATTLCSEEFQATLESYMMLVYVGKPHFSGTNNWELFKQHIDGINNVPTFFEKLKQNALTMQSALQAEDIKAVAAALNQDWQTRKTMLPTMTTPEIEQLTQQVMNEGALAARVCGAGAGGCVLLLVEPTKKKAILETIKALKMQYLPMSLEPKGVQVTTLD